MSLVVDASAMVRAVIFDDDIASELRMRLVAEHVHAPYLIDAEVGNVLRRRVLHGSLANPLAETARAAAIRLVGVRYPHTGSLGEHAWRLRDTMTFYDGLYAALAGALEMPLLTADRRLAAAPGLPCAVEVVR